MIYKGAEVCKKLRFENEAITKLFWAFMSAETISDAHVHEHHYY